MWIFLFYWLYRECWEPAFKKGKSCLVKTRAPGPTSHLDAVSQERVPTALCVSLSSRANFLWTHCCEDMFLIRPGFDSDTSYITALPHLFWLEAVSSEWHLQRWRGDQCCPLHTADPPFCATSSGSRGCQAQQRRPKAQPLSTRAALPHEQQGSSSEAWSDIFPFAINNLISTWSQPAVRLEIVLT